MTLESCPKDFSSNLLKRAIFYGNGYYGDRYRSWEWCMSRTGCKAGAIASIVVGSIFLLWLLVYAVALCFGATALASILCCGLRGRNRPNGGYNGEQQYYNTNMYNQQPPIHDPRYQSSPIYNQPFQNGQYQQGQYQNAAYQNYPPNPHVQNDGIHGPRK